MSDVRSLREQVAALRTDRLAKASSSLREACEARAALAFRRALDVSGLSQREYSRRADVDERTVRDWACGARNVPLYAVMALPRDGQIEFASVVIDELPPESKRSGTDG